MILSEENYTEISSNENILALVIRLIKRGEKLIASNYPKGQYVCSCDLGTVQRLGYRK